MLVVGGEGVGGGVGKGLSVDILYPILKFDVYLNHACFFYLLQSQQV